MAVGGAEAARVEVGIDDDCRASVTGIPMAPMSPDCIEPQPAPLS
jgi:hypothetical protein